MQEGTSHAGIKGSRCVWLGDRDQIFTTGYSRMAAREYGLWDVRNLGESLTIKSVDSSSGMLMPFYDADTNCVFLAGKVCVRAERVSGECAC